MPNLSLRGLDANVLTRIKTDAQRRKISVNRIIIDTLTRQFGTSAQTYDDLDALVGKWSKRQAGDFEAAIAPFGEVDTALWAAEPKASYRVSAPGAAKAKRRSARR